MIISDFAYLVLPRLYVLVSENDVFYLSIATILNDEAYLDSSSL